MSYIGASLNQTDWFFNPTEEQKAEEVQNQAMIDKMANDPALQAQASETAEPAIQTLQPDQNTQTAASQTEPTTTAPASSINLKSILIISVAGLLLLKYLRS